MVLHTFRFLYFTRTKYVKNNFEFFKVASNNFDHPLNHNFKDKLLEFPGSKCNVKEMELEGVI